MRKIYSIASLLLFGAMFAFFQAGIVGCNRGTPPSEKKPDQTRPVRAVELKSLSQNRSCTFPGTAVAIRETNLSFRVGGPLIRYNLETGQRLTKGQVLAQIDPRDFEVQVKALTARLHASKAQKEEAWLQFKRYRNLVKEKGVSKARFDHVKTAYETAVAQVDADIKNLEAARNALKDTVLKAPFTGYIHTLYVEDHETVPAGQPVISLVDISGMEVEVNIPEDLLPRAPHFTSFSCVFDAFPDKRFRAVFKEIGKRPNPSNQTYLMTLTLDQDKSATVLPGMTAEVTVTISNQYTGGLFVVPAESVLNDNNRRSFVWIYNPEDGRVRKQFVTIKNIVPEGIEISGALDPGDRVVTAGAHCLKDKQKVRILTPPSRTNVGNLL